MGRLADIIGGAEHNYLLPFYWQHGDHYEKIPAQIERIWSSGCRALCVEARPHPGFCGDTWWRDMDLILSECRRRSMKVWILDDKHFPTGYANGAIEKKPHLRRWNLTERHVDVVGPAQGTSLLFEPSNAEEPLLGIIARRRAENDAETLSDESIDLSGALRDDGSVRFDIPDGCWRVFFIYKTRRGSTENYIDFITPESASQQIAAVYEPHWEHYGDEFGKTIAGFFSDEPQFHNVLIGGYHVDPGLYSYGIGQEGLALPVNDRLLGMMEKSLGRGVLARLPELWYASPGAPDTRLAYMDSLTTLYRECFSQPVGDWCRAHGVEYIGHVIEDLNAHGRMGYGPGHYFRAIAPQDMGGMDVVLHQVLPGMGKYRNTTSALGGSTSADFNHCVLACLAMSVAHQSPWMRGRAMCEVFGAYGWAEGVPTMKWLIDFLLVRGINHFVPHAFSPVFPDRDCPPHFGAEGHDPSFEGFGSLMRYVNKAAHLLCGGRHVAHVAILYHAEGEWMGGIGNAMLAEKPARRLSDKHIPYEIVPRDSLIAAEAANGAITVGEETFSVVVVPYSPRLPDDVIGKLSKLEGHGLRVMFAGGVPEGAKGTAIPLDSLAEAVEEAVEGDVGFPDGHPLLRHLHISRDGEDVFMFFNEDPAEVVDCEVRLPVRGDCARLKMLENRIERDVSGDGRIRLELEPGESEIIVFGEVAGDKPLARCGDWRAVKPASFEISVADEQDPGSFKPLATAEALFNIYDRIPRFAGKIRYCFSIGVNHGGRFWLDLGTVGDVARVRVNGEDAGMRICRPYRYAVNLRDGTNEIEVEVTNNLGMRMRDPLSRHLAVAPAGILGPLRICGVSAQLPRALC